MHYPQANPGSSQRERERVEKDDNQDKHTHKKLPFFPIATVGRCCRDRQYGKVGALCALAQQRTHMIARKEGLRPMQILARSSRVRIGRTYFSLGSLKNRRGELLVPWRYQKFPTTLKIRLSNK